MKFCLENKFDLIFIPKNGLKINKSLEFVFWNKIETYEHLKKIWWNFKQDLDPTFTIKHEEKIELSSWYHKEDWTNNIFYDYNELEIKVSDTFKLTLENDYNNSWFLISDYRKEDWYNYYKLTYSLSDEQNKIYGFWGFVKFKIYNDNEEFFFVPFFKTKNLEEELDVLKMLWDIKEELFYSLYTHKNISLSWYNIKQKREEQNPWWSFINLFELLYKDLESSINDIHNNAKYLNRLDFENKKYNSWKIIIDNRFINDCIKKWYYDNKTWSLNIYWKNISQKKIVWDYNNTSNKVFIHLMQNLNDKLNSFLRLSEWKINETYTNLIKDKKDVLQTKRIGFINKYDLSLSRLGNLNIDFQYLDSRYKKFVLNYLKLFFVLELLDWEIMLANKSIDQIYEYWVLIKTRDILSKLSKSGKKSVFKIKKSNDSLIFELGDSNIKINSKDWKTKITYSFQKTISTIWDNTWFLEDNIKVISTKMNPDIFIKILNNDIEKYYIFDAKYSTDENWNIHKDRLENLYKYKSWIVKCKNLEYNEQSEEWKWKMNNIIDEVIAIFPWRKEEKLSKLYKKSIDDIWFWALTMKPWEEEEIKNYFLKKFNLIN